MNKRRIQDRAGTRDRDLRALAVDANNVPFEFSADALIRTPSTARSSRDAHY